MSMNTPSPYLVQYKRASDIFVPPASESHRIEWDFKSDNIEKLADWFDREKFTGVMKAGSRSQTFRGAILLFCGWCVGAVYSSKSADPVKHTYLALPALLTRLKDCPDAELEIYSLPDEIVLPFSSAFIGQFMEPTGQDSPGQKARYFVEKVTNLPRHCLITMNEPERGLCLVYFYLGKISGHFLVNKQQFTNDQNFPYHFIEKAENAGLHLSILSAEIQGVYDGTTRFGFPLITTPSQLA